MKCENCGMGFIITPINVDKVCPHCGHVHGIHKEDNMIKKIWNKIKEISKRLMFWTRL